MGKVIQFSSFKDTRNVLIDGCPLMLHNVNHQLEEGEILQIPDGEDIYKKLLKFFGDRGIILQDNFVIIGTEDD